MINYNLKKNFKLKLTGGNKNFVKFQNSHFFCRHYSLIVCHLNQNFNPLEVSKKF